MVDRRSSVALSYGQISKALDLLPVTIWVKDKETSTLKFMPYPFQSFKRAPDWAKLDKVKLAIRELLDQTGGINVYQTSMRDAMHAWLKQADFEVLVKDQDAACYSLRAMISQLSNHKQRDRDVPKHWQPKLSTLFAKVALPTHTIHIKDPDPNTNAVDDDVLEGSDGDRDDDHAVHSLNSSPMQIESSDDDVDITEKGKAILASDNPELARLLDCSPDLEGDAPETPAKNCPRRRISQKSPEPLSEPKASAEPEAATHRDGEFSYDQMSALAGGAAVVDTKLSAQIEIGPKAWSSLTQKKKKDRLTSMKAMKKPSKAMKKSMKAKGKSSKVDGPITWSCFLKREHSKAFHAERDFCRKSGLSQAVCKQRASEVACKKTLELREERAKGMHGQYT